MKNKRMLLLLLMSVLLVSALLARNSYAALFTPLPYYNWYNVSVPNWNYTNGSFHSPAKFVMLTLNISNPNYISTRGYDSSLNSRGSVPFWIDGLPNGNQVTIIASKTTNTSVAWNTLTVYYNPKPSYQGILAELYTGVHQTYGNLTGLQNSGSSNCTYNNQQVYFIGYVWDQTKYSYCTPYYGNSNSLNNNFNFIFTLNTSFTDSFVLMTPSSFFARLFNLSWSASPLYTFSVVANTTPGHYRMDLISRGGIYTNPFVSNTGTIPTTEIWFGDQKQTTFNGIYTDGMGFSGGFLRNSTNSVAVNLNLFPSLNQFTLTADTNEPTVYTIVPAFTTNTVIVPVVNPSNAISPALGCTPSHYFCFVYRYNITNIKWQFNYSSNATGSNAITSPVWANFNSGKVPYAKIKIPYYSSLMGPYCDDIMVTDAVYNDTIPFYANCTSNTGILILPNITSNARSYNSINVYYDSGIYESPVSSSASVFNGWQFASGNYFTVSPSPYLPFTVSLSSPLNLFSTIGTTGTSYGGDCSGNADSYFSQYNGYFDELAVIIQTGGGGCASGGAISAIDTSGYRSTNFLYAPYSNGNILTIASKNIMAVQLTDTPTSEAIISNTVYKNSVNAGGSIVLNVYANFYANLFNGITATAQYLYTTTYTNGSNNRSPGLVCNPNVVGSGCYVPNYPNITSTIPQTTNGINFNNTTTFNFNALSNSTMVYLAPNVPVPKYVVLVISIIVIIVGGSMLTIHDLGHWPFLLMLLGLWISGFFTYQLWVVALIFTILFIGEEYLGHKLSHKRGG